MADKESRESLGLFPENNPGSSSSNLKKNKTHKQDPLEASAEEYSKYEATMEMVLKEKKARRRTRILISLIMIGMLCGVGWWGYGQYQNQEEEKAQRQIQLAELHSVGSAALSQCHWDDAEGAYQKMLSLEPNYPAAKDGIKLIQKGRSEDRQKQLSEMLNQSQIALESGRLPEAEKWVQKLLVIDPENAEGKQKLAIIAEAKHQQAVVSTQQVITTALDEDDVFKARMALAELKKLAPNNADLLGYQNRIDQIAEASRVRRLKASQLLEAAMNLDNGEFSEEALTLLGMAKDLDPANARITAQYTKMNNYSRTINVPTDYSTIGEALTAARPRDIIKLAAGTYQEALEIHQPVQLQGAGEGQTILQLPASEASLITIYAEAAETAVTGITMKHEGFNHNTDRYSGMTVMAKDVIISLCSITRSGGHGIAIIKGGSATISDCRISNCGWDGIAVYGENSQATLKAISSRSNIQHGLDVWGGGSAVVSKSNMSKNELCGISAMGIGGKVVIHETICFKNRDAGILVSHGVKATVNANRCDENRLSGIVVRSKETVANITNNVTVKNGEAGILTHLGVQIRQFQNNQSSDNTARQIWRNAIVRESTE